MDAIISLLGLAATFAIAYGFDRWSELLRRQASATFAPTSYYWFFSISNLIFAGLMLVLAWFVCFRANKTRVIPVIFMIVGLFATFVFAVDVSILAPDSHYMITPFPLMPNTRVAHVAAFITVIGFAGLLLSKND
ncbi:MAG: hypothetical protein MZV64_35120 [Ignavibacteriales bacterium]|nr:hypothetical protein [Ignavibacteriales bacterium]